MAVKLTDKVHVVRDRIPTKNLGSALANSGRDAVTVAELLGATIETGLQAPELGLLGTGSFSSITYDEQYGSYTVINGRVTFDYKVVVSAYTIAKQTGQVLIPYVTLPFAVAPGGFDNVVQPLVHKIGQWQGNAQVEFSGGPGVVPAGACWTYQDQTNPKSSQQLKDTQLISPIPGTNVETLIFTGTVSYLKAQ
tara:strand:+ start:5021 stop:5602 length:582 start_codon:yes stop_codon:yes gene_type:complete